MKEIVRPMRIGLLRCYCFCPRLPLNFGCTCELDLQPVAIRFYHQTYRKW